MKKEPSVPVEISEKALMEIKHILKTKGIPQEYGLRIATKGMGCSVGFKLGFDKKKADDEVYEVGGVQVLIKKSELMFVIGKRIEFYDESDGRGFMFV